MEFLSNLMFKTKNDKVFCKGNIAGFKRPHKSFISFISDNKHLQTQVNENKSFSTDYDLNTAYVCLVEMNE